MVHERQQLIKANSPLLHVLLHELFQTHSLGLLPELCAGCTASMHAATSPGVLDPDPAKDDEEEDAVYVPGPARPAAAAPV